MKVNISKEIIIKLTQQFYSNSATSWYSLAYSRYVRNGLRPLVVVLLTCS